MTGGIFGLWMSKSNTFVKDIERYFLLLAGKGLMLSSKDYYLIDEWMDRGLSKEQVFNGIRDAFESRAGDRVRSIYDCKEHVESNETKSCRSELSNNNLPEIRLYIDSLVKNFNRLIVEEKSAGLCSLHNEYKAALCELDASEKSTFEKINEIEKQYFQRIRKYLEESEDLNFSDQVEKSTNAPNNYINEGSREKLLNAYLKNLIIEKYIYFNPFEVGK